MHEITFFLCTRDRSQIVERHLKGIDRSLQKFRMAHKARYFIVDDSTEDDHKQNLRTLTRSITWKHLELFIIDTQIQEAILSQIEGNIEFHEVFSRRTKKLGTGVWDLASARNLAFICAYVLGNPSNVFVFFDDDMMLDDIYYAGYQYSIDGSEILNELFRATHGRRFHASGCGYWGRTDISIIEHLSFILEAFNNSESILSNHDMETSLKEFPNKLPIRIDTPATVLEGTPGVGPGGISGAVLATTYYSIRSHFVPQVYNEDWIWLLFLGEVRNPITCISKNVVHAAPPQPKVSQNFILYQQYGEVLYHALASINAKYPGGIDKLDWFKNNLSVAVINEAKHHEISKVKNWIELLTLLNSNTKEKADFQNSLESLYLVLVDILRGLEQIDPVEMQYEVSQYVNDVYTWRNMLDYAKSNISIPLS